jgi:hypothetical protein
LLTGAPPVTSLYPPVSAAVIGKWSKVTGSICLVTVRGPVKKEAYLSLLQLVSGLDRGDRWILEQETSLEEAVVLPAATPDLSVGNRI